MTDTSGLTLHGDAKNNRLGVKVILKDDGDRYIYNILDGGDGDDYLTATNEAFKHISAKFGASLSGGNGNDELIDSNGVDTLLGGAGDDHISIHAGHDIVDGGAGYDVLDGGASLYMAFISVAGIEQIDMGSGVSGAQLHASSTQLSQLEILNSAATFGTALQTSGRVSLKDVKLIGTHWGIIAGKLDDTIDLTTSTADIGVQGMAGDDRITTGSGADALYGVSGNDVLAGGDGKDLLDGGYGNDRLYGGAQDDSIQGGGGSDVIFGGSGNDILDAGFGKGHDTISGGSGNDKIYLLVGGSVAHGDAGNDTIEVWSSKTQAFGDAGNDTFRVFTSEPVTLSGGSGDDVVDIEAGTQKGMVVHGGSGMDTLAVFSGMNGLKWDGFEILRAGFPVTIGADDLASFKYLQSAGDLFIKLSSGGNVSLHMKGEDPSLATIVGSSQDDHVRLNDMKGEWTFKLGAGDDVATGGDGKNSMWGGSGDDHLSGRGTYDYLSGGEGNDTILGYGSKNAMFGGSGDDYIVGRGTQDTVNGGQGDDTIIAGGGFQLITGNSGHDRFEFTNSTHYAIVYDFDIANDSIDLSHVSAIDDLKDLLAHHVKMIAHGYALLITFGDSEIAFAGLKAADLHTADVIF